MKNAGNEVRTGILVIFSLTILVGVLLYLGAPGVFVSQHTYFVYFDNAYGIKAGTDVMLAGRKVGQVRHVFSPIPQLERPEPQYESLVEVKVDARAAVYNKVDVQMMQLTMLGDMMIDFSNGDEASGLATEGARFNGKRQPGLSDAVPQVLEKLDPVVKKATATLDSLQKTSDNLSVITAEEGDLRLSLVEFRKLGVHLNELSGAGGPLRVSLENLEHMTCEDSDLARTLANAERFTSDLANNRDIEVALRNLRRASANVDHAVLDVSPRISTIGQNLEQASDTIKRQPWRLIWPTTKRYGDERPRSVVKTATPEPKPRRLVSGR
jgi:ABC-type transporter Mla subunit MlaD